MKTHVGSVVMAALLVAVAARAEDELGRVGESCRARADCQSGLACKNQVCVERAPKKGAPVEQVKAEAVRPPVPAPAVPQPWGSPPPPPPGGQPVPQPWRAAQPAPMAQPVAPEAAPQVVGSPMEPTFVSEMVLPPPLADAPGGPVVAPVPAAVAARPGAPSPMAAAVVTPPAPSSAVAAAPAMAVSAPPTVVAESEPAAPKSIMDENHFFLGLKAGAGPSTVYGYLGPRYIAGLPAAFRLGGLFHFFELALEVSPGSQLYVGTIADSHFVCSATIAAYITLVRREAFAVVLPLRAGLGVDFTSQSVDLQGQLLGVGLRTGRMLYELSLFAPRVVSGSSVSQGALTFPVSLSASLMF